MAAAARGAARAADADSQAAVATAATPRALVGSNAVRTPAVAADAMATAVPAAAQRPLVASDGAKTTALAAPDTTPRPLAGLVALTPDGGPAQVLTFGCRLNALESEQIRRAAVAAGLRDVLIVNSCAVTREAVRQARQAIRRARRADPGLRVVLTGCAAETEPDAFAGMAEVDLVVGNPGKTMGATWVEAARALAGTPAAEKHAAQKPAAEGNGLPALAPRAAGALSPSGDAPGPGEPGSAHTRGFVAVQTGCDHSCTFCIIPKGRGPSRSTPLDQVIDQARARVASGQAEVVLTGVDLTSYGADLAGVPPLGRLVRTLLAAVPELKRLRLSSIDAAEADAELIAAFAEEPRLMPHLHLSLQSGDDTILKRMKRRHSRADALDLAARLRRARPDIVLGADLIAGFPTETEAQALATRDFVAAAGLAFVHVFPFSARPGTPAARMPQLPAAVVAARAAGLREAAGRALRAHLAREVGTRRQVLAEAGGRGYTEHFTPARLAASVPRGALVEARIIGHDGVRLIAA